jgi:NADP-dependent 3-hydroxy acid dehydrogenase YdfG
MKSKLTGTAAIVTGASSGIGAATARRLAALGASVALLARRHDRLEALAADIDKAGGTALVVAADITDRAQAEAAVQETVERFGRLDTLVNNAGLMLLGPVVGADVDEWQQMIAVNQQGLLYITKAALPHLLKAAGDGLRQVADIVNISSIAGRTAFPGMGVYNMTKFGLNGFSEALRQELTASHVRVGVLEPGKVDTELDSHNTDEVISEIEANYGHLRILDPEDIADGVTYMVTRPRHAAISELWIMPTEQS